MGSELDLVIRGGTLVDGTGAPARRADVGIRGDRIVVVGDVPPGRREIDVRDAIVAPGFIDTDMTRGLGEGQHEALLTQIPLGRLGQPEDIAQAVAFLAGPGAAYVTGTTLHVNGGMYMN